LRFNVTHPANGGQGLEKVLFPEQFYKFVKGAHAKQRISANIPMNHLSVLLIQQASLLAKAESV
jgi:hypothetical protein